MAVCVLLPGIAGAGDIFSTLFGGAKDSPAAASPKVSAGTHETSKIVDVKGETKGIKLQTLATGPDGMVYALLGSDRYGAKVSSGEVQVFDSTGEKVRGWKVDFQCQAINCASDGTVFVAGDGKLATFDAAGQVKSAPLDLPFIQRVLADAEALKKKAEEQKASEIQSYEEIVKDVEKQLEELKKKDEENLTKAEKQQIKQFEAMITNYKRTLEASKKKKPEDYVNQIVSRVRIINSIAATEKDLYVVCGALQGYGYAVWRMDRNFENAKQVMSGLRGCCGQMDVQCCGDDLIVAQNCEHNVGRYDRDGKKLGTFGRRAGRDGSDDGFTGCCNPMNVRADADGRVYTAESEGIVRVFGKDGKAQGMLGSVKITGGCKNVAIALSKDGNTVFFCDQPGSKIHLMTRKPDSAKGAN
jgi:sugar lactone lactonase YvrE